MAEHESMSKGDIIRAAFAALIQRQMREKHVARATRTQKVFALLHVENDDIANELYLSILYDYIKSHTATI